MNNQKEIWKDIPSYEGHYQASTKGNIRSIKNGIIRNKSLRNHNAGYLAVDLYKNNNQTTFLIHRIIALTFILNNENKREVNHIDGNKKNNNLLNLEWATSSENKQHGIKNGLINDRKPVAQFDLEGNLLKEFESIKQAARETECSDARIVGVCKGRRNSTKGYIWKYI